MQLRSRVLHSGMRCRGAFVKSETVGRPMEILLVEDSLTSARLTMGVLKKANLQHRMTWLSDGAEASDFVHRRGKYVKAPRPDLILLDLGLPGKDGREVLSELKGDHELRKIPVVVLTASTSEVDISSSERLNVESYLTKPVDLDRFLSVVRELNRFWHADMILPPGAAADAGATASPADVESRRTVPGSDQSAVRREQSSGLGGLIPDA